MDTTKLTLSLPVDKFFETYVATIRNLYGSSFIAQNHLEPATKSSFQRSMSKRAGISVDKREDSSQYSKDDLLSIVEDTNVKYEEYTKGDYSESTKARGQARYRLLSDILHATLSQLGYQDVAEKLKYTGDRQAVTKDTVTTEDKEETAAVKKNVKILKESLTTISEKLKKLSEKPLSDQDRESLAKVKESLKETIESAKKCVKSKSDSAELKTLVQQGEEYIMKIQELLTDKNLEQTLQSSVTPTTTPGAGSTADDILTEIPLFVDKIKAIVQRNEELLATVKQLKEEVEIVKQKTVLPDDDDALVQLIKETVHKVEDKTKLKDIVMLIALKVM